MKKEQTLGGFYRDGYDDGYDPTKTHISTNTMDGEGWDKEEIESYFQGYDDGSEAYQNYCESDENNSINFYKEGLIAYFGDEMDESFYNY
jgi:hypothetical protein